MRRILSIIAVLLLSLGGACSTPTPAARPATQPSRRIALPVEFTVKQRTTHAIPGSEGRLLLTIDDITRDQVMASLAGDDGATVLAVRSMSPGDATPFRFGADEYKLTLKSLDNALLGGDAAAFVISDAAGTHLTEDARIDRLIQAIADLKGAGFIRNNAEYSAADAAEHLRTKRRAAGGDIKSAEQFISAIATKSSISGEPYQIRLPDGRLVPSAQYLRDRLAEMEKGR